MSSTDYEVRWQESKEYGVRTKYLRTVLSMTLESMNENQVCRVDPALMGKLQKVVQRVSLRSPPEAHSYAANLVTRKVYFVRDGENLAFYAWLQPREMEYLNGAGESFLTVWIPSLTPSSRWSLGSEGQCTQCCGPGDLNSVISGARAALSADLCVSVGAEAARGEG